MTEQIDLIVHIPLEAEYLEFREVFPVTSEIKDDFNVIARLKSPSGLQVVVIVQEKMGRSFAQTACQKILGLFSPRLYVCLGIAGGLSKDLSLGDVCYTGGLVDVYDNSKVTDVEGGGVDIALAPEFYSTDRRVTASIGFVRTLTSLSPLYDYWKEDQSLFAKVHCPFDVVGRAGEIEKLSTPKCLNGDIVCGAVSESDAYRDRLRGITRNILAIETESGPIFQICRDAGLSALTIRGISDYANASKGKLEGDTKDAVRKVAARNAATFLHMQLQNDAFVQALLRMGFCEATQPRLFQPPQSEPISIAEMLDTLSEEVDTKLRELSPSYRTKPVGFRLPFPRVRQEIASAAGDEKVKPREVEFQTAISTHKRLMLFIPRNYPDQALPWMLANGLIEADVAGRKALPIVIDGARISAPKDGLSHLASVELVDSIESRGAEYVFLINEPPFASSRHMAFLDNELKRWPNCRAVLLTRRDRALVEGLDGVGSLKLDTFTLCDVSFLEIAAFVESSFDLPSQEAEVIALRLRGMFKKFALPAHPSFFAGIPSEALAALLLANRRSELIQLAVDGFLSFVVASDRKKAKMSRGARSSYLRRLVVETMHAKRSFDQAELIKFTQEISDEFDYGLDPIEFISGFSDAGLIHFEDGKVVLTLPFMASYLFADEMAKRPSLANEYFLDFADDTDLSVFDLYSEVGPSTVIIERVIRNLSSAVANIPPHNGPHVLLTALINPVIFRNPARLTNLSQTVSSARKALADGVSSRDEKARVLDIVDRVSEDIAENDRAESKRSEPEAAEIQAITSLSRAWTISTILMGSGAESINGASRQSLAQSIIVGAEALLDATLRHTAGQDFEEIKRQIIGDGKFREELGAVDDPKFDAVVSAIVDLIEFMALSEPLDRVFDQLPDGAKHDIIGNSVRKVDALSPIQNLIKLNWLTNIFPKEEKGALIRALHDLPRVHFVRASLTSIYMMRTKWRVADYDTRMALLDAAAEAVRPYNPSLDKGEVIRFVQKHLPGFDEGTDTGTDEP